MASLSPAKTTTKKERRKLRLKSKERFLRTGFWHVSVVRVSVVETFIINVIFERRFSRVKHCVHGNGGWPKSVYKRRWDCDLFCKCSNNRVTNLIFLCPWQTPSQTLSKLVPFNSTPPLSQRRIHIPHQQTAALAWNAFAELTCFKSHLRASPDRNISPPKI